MYVSRNLKVDKAYLEANMSSLSELSSEISIEISRAIRSESSLFNNLSSNLKNQLSFGIINDSSLSTAIIYESVTRISGENSLSSALNVESLARVSGEVSLSKVLSNETTFRIMLSSALNDESTFRVSGEISLSSALNAESISRLFGENSLSNLIVAEGISRVSRDSSIISYVNEVTADLVNINDNLVIISDKKMSSYSIPSNCQLNITNLQNHSMNYIKHDVSVAHPTKIMFSTFGIEINNVVSQVAFSPSGVLHAVGTFTTANGYSIPSIAKWTGSKWTIVGSVKENFYGVGCLEFDASGNLYIGGLFTVLLTNGNIANNIAMFDGATWTTLNGGTNQAVMNMKIGPDGSLYVAGNFTQVGATVSAGRIAKWDGSNWSTVGTGVGFNNIVYAIEFHNEVLYAGGSFGSVDGINAGYMAKWDGTVWNRMNMIEGKNVSNSIYTFAFDNSGNLYIGGMFTRNKDAEEIMYVAKLVGTSYVPLGSGMNASVKILKFDSAGNLYAGGDFTTAGGISANYLAKWNGTSWSPVDSGTSASVHGMNIRSNSDIYICGNFSVAGDVTANKIAKLSTNLIDLSVDGQFIKTTTGNETVLVSKTKTGTVLH